MRIPWCWCVLTNYLTAAASATGAQLNDAVLDEVSNRHERVLTVVDGRSANSKHEGVCTSQNRMRR